MSIVDPIYVNQLLTNAGLASVVSSVKNTDGTKAGLQIIWSGATQQQIDQGQAILDAYDPDAVAAEVAANTEIQIVAKEQLAVILRDALKQDPPDAPGTKAALEAVISTHPVMGIILSNTAAIQGLNLATNPGYIAAVQIALPLYLAAL